MQVEEMRTLARQRLARIEEAYGSDSRLPSHILAAYKFYALVSDRSFSRYFTYYGCEPVEFADLEEAKREFAWGNVSPFELDVLTLLAERCRELEGRPLEARVC